MEPPIERESVEAAKKMVMAYGLHRLKIAPALKVRHTESKAIDINISWRDFLKIKNSKGVVAGSKTTPRTGMNSELHKVATTYNVIKFSGGIKKQPHWSMDGR